MPPPQGPTPDLQQDLQQDLPPDRPQDRPQHLRHDLAVLLPRDLPAADVLTYARRAEGLGFDELWVVEDLGFRGGVAQAAAVLAATTRIRVGVGILPAAARNAAFAAMEVATLAALFPGRVDVGVGHGMPGWMRSAGAWPARPLGLLEAWTTAVRDLLAGRTVTLHAAGVDLDAVALDPSAVPAVAPRLLAGVRGPRSLALAGRVLDGTVLAEPVTPEYVGAAREQIAAPGPHRVVGYHVTSVDEDAARALAAARPGLRWVGEPDWAPHLAPLPFADGLAELRAEVDGPEAFARRMPDAWVRQLALAGTPSDVRARLSALSAAGLDCSVLMPVGDDPLGALEDLATLREPLAADAGRPRLSRPGPDGTREREADESGPRRRSTPPTALRGQAAARRRGGQA
ncbi:LLM class flavin-dependent oxidoreductase [Cellulomonas marina]|uniref:Flavin-dependent oxidoreductase, luciferase family (Includes alkanesulfonate monooxygenase SsuD and methylene tetrahydromethanopterin reductase) n=1 Tax=Cellulomonas marina TaxID=988821 RepID=A0A1I0ZEN3_9CELL|nr:LLM class flavin-dependent oxidoreductase [Cellulomonas marina]GIG30629.1 N5,N10-methylene tetrahydromethanopterin reductase [Cellulomonas marina]SFB23000.1 Flavin-dependent oxidoreductase, luciferase family (includes alkanesulfonate monooxygenase SsuD and methylene tetrahydromethanopterin reductase) [Cellulomonas marina]